MTRSKKISEVNIAKARMVNNDKNLSAQPLLSDPIFSLENHQLAYKHQAVFSDISLTIKQGEKVAIIGASGVGKTSLLNTLYSQQIDNIAFCQQQLNLIPNLSAYNNIYLGRLNEFSVWQNLRNLVSTNKEQWQIIANIAEQLAIEHQLKKSISQLSGGQKQRVAIARALYQRKAIFFADEPVSSLDPELAHQVLALLVEQHQCCVMTLHDRQLALDHFDRIIGLKRFSVKESAKQYTKGSDNHSQIVIDQSTADLQLADLDALYQ